MRTFRREIASILTALSGSPWATHPQVQSVLAEYGYLKGVIFVLNGRRRISLQIFHASRAIDTLLAHIASTAASKPGAPAPPRYLTLAESYKYINRAGLGGMTFSPATTVDLRNIKNARNTYLHQADMFPSEADMQRFLSKTINALQEATTFPP
jgi:hypothetical protein